jgi:GNAT superfamily N-acetyltransferase
MSTVLQIRPPRPEEFSDIARIFYDAVHHIACKDYSAEQIQAWAPCVAAAEHWLERTASLETRIGLRDGCVAGFLGFSAAGYIDLLFTNPAFVRQGVASALLKDAEQFLRAAGVQLATTEASLTAQPFFERMGFDCVRQQTVICNGVELRNFLMEKRLRDDK